MFSTLAMHDGNFKAKKNYEKEIPWYALLNGSKF